MVHQWCQYVNFVVVKQLRPWLHLRFFQELNLYPNLEKNGPWDDGDMAVWLSAPLLEACRL